MLDLVGTPYEERGLGPASFDCWGLVRYVLNNQYGMSLAEWPPSFMAWPDYVKIYKPPPTKFEPYDVVMFSEILPGIVNHVGIVCSNGADFIHCSSCFGGVVCEPLIKYAHKIIAVGRPKL
jgi:cell wall-associated NlpC family hydrolase